MAAKEKILIIDDDADVCDTYDAFLLDDAYDLHFAHNGGEGLVRAMEISPDLILPDVMMPDMDGFEVCNYLKSDPKLKHIPVILITALESRQALMLGFEAGADEFLPKPVRGGELRVRSMLRIKKLYDQLIEPLCLREELVNMIVHDIKNPLSVIMGLSQVLKMQITDPGHSDYYPTAMIMNGDIAGARRRHALPGRRSCAGSAGMPHQGAHASGMPL